MSNSRLKVGKLNVQYEYKPFILIVQKTCTKTNMQIGQFLKWKAYREMESKVAAQPRMNNRKMFVVSFVISWIDSLHT